MKRKPVAGETLYSLNIGNYARNKPQVLTPVKVVKVGRKYFTCSEEGKTWGATEYHIDTWAEKTEYSAHSALYESQQEWENEKEASKLCNLISEVFQYGRNSRRLSLNDLRAIASIIAKPEVAATALQDEQV